MVLGGQGLGERQHFARGNVPTLASLNVPAGAGTVSATGVQWGRFLPSGWQEYLSAGFTVTSAYMAPAPLLPAT